ncbi:hypothetical protein DUNSADRAFT_13773 [Dunaliella salina]|uniref:BTB domain-containing protein n=1 Tax=Dunaliella salina TaxID=3046 RepID=A0ABQ7G8S0_DUNSA|nr:hypothetical protein DUNSADRAFT_13773 [Dunaliella salina]|eukprot:KAF5830988.1 hypothetical protein DUNSADRAFT_13773 [Dunaliella salina]
MIRSAWLWRDQALSDVNIVLYVPDGTEQPSGKKRKLQGGTETAETEVNMRVIPGHKVILASCSKYFEASIKRKMDGSMSGLSDTLGSSPEAVASLASVAEASKAQGKLLLMERCESAADLEAAESCLRAMYLQESPLEGKLSSCDLEQCISFLLKMARWVDLWHAECISGSCVVALRQLTCAASFEARHLNELLHGLPEFLTSPSAPAKALVTQVCSKWLLHKYKDVYEVVTVEEKRHAFCELCAEAVIIWATQDDLCGSKNDVAIALAYWSTAAGGEQHLPFFTEHKDLVMFTFLVSESKLGPAFAHERCKWRSSARMGRATASYPTGPFEPPNPFAAEILRQSSEYTWAVPADDIRHATAASPKMLEPALYVKGFLLRASVVMVEDDLHIHVAPAGNHVIPAPLGVYAKLEMTCGGSTMSGTSEVWVDGTFHRPVSHGYIRRPLGGGYVDPTLRVREMLDRGDNVSVRIKVEDMR